MGRYIVSINIDEVSLLSITHNIFKQGLDNNLSKSERKRRLVICNKE